MMATMNNAMTRNEWEAFKASPAYPRKRSEHDALARKIDAAAKELERNQWELVATMMTDTPWDGEFGRLYSKNGREFWVNILTYENLPQD